MKKIVTTILIFCPLYFFGWGAEGHKIVADIAKAHLNQGVEVQVQKYLGATSFEKASTWMDEVRSDHNFDYLKPWHYANIEKGGSYSEAKNGDIVSELNIVISKLRDYKKMEPAAVSQGLKMLFHLCGDITQPLHVGYGSDKGGNSYQLVFEGGNTNLHRIWDSEIIGYSNIKLEMCNERAKKISTEPIFTQIDVMAWMNDSRALLPSVYNIQDNKISKEYITSNTEIIENQLAKGGIILALVLNDIFKN